MPELSRSQIAVYGALAVVALLLGARWIRSADDGAAVAPRFAEEGPVDQASGEGSGGLSFEQSSGDLVVHVAGEVTDPGVYRLPAGSRVTDAVERAGGATRDGAVDAINLAAGLADGQQVVVPARARGPAGSAGAVPAATAADGPISLGSATVEQLDTIEGIGPVTAQDIIAFRDERGGLSSIDELDEISGIGPATMEALRDRLQP